MLTELEAWKKLVELWKSPTGVDSGNKMFVVLSEDANTTNKYRCYGLCDCISRFYSNELISITIKRSMLEKIKNNTYKTDLDNYIWKLDETGAQERVKLCEKIVKEMEEENEQKV